MHRHGMTSTDGEKMQSNFPDDWADVSREAGYAFASQDLLCVFNDFVMTCTCVAITFRRHDKLTQKIL